MHSSKSCRLPANVCESVKDSDFVKHGIGIGPNSVSQYTCIRAALLLVVVCGTHAIAERPTSTVPEVGIRDRTPTLQALLNANVCTEAGKSTSPQTILIDGGVIVQVGKDLAIPERAERIDLDGKTIYPALIEPYSEISVPVEKDRTAHWNPKATPHRRALSGWKRKADEDKSFREAGFALRLIAPNDGVLRGESAVVTTGDGLVADSVVREQVAQHLRLTTRGRRDQFPTSPMGAVALARQTFYDANWYRDAWRAYESGKGIPRPESNRATSYLAEAINTDQLFVFNAPDEQYVLRANRFAIEFQLNNVAMVASGREYQRLEAVAKAARTLIVPVNFSKAPNVATVEAAQDATLADLMHWHFAPQNPPILLNAGVHVVLTSHGLKKRTDFRSQIRKAVKAGLDPVDALRACTMDPARLLGIENVAGSIAVGKAAHFMVTDGDWLKKETQILETWVDGERFEHKPRPTGTPTGIWKLTVDASDDVKKTVYLQWIRNKGKLTGKAWNTEPTESIEDEKKKEKSDAEATTDFVELRDIDAGFGRLSAKFSAQLWDRRGTVRLTGTLVSSDGTPQWLGQLRDELGTTSRFKGLQQESTDAKQATDDQSEENPEGEQKPEEGTDSESIALDVPLVYPMGAFGMDEQIAKSQTIVFENATLWTCSENGVVEGSILIENGQIVAVGPSLAIPENATRVDAAGKHITPGIVDCHSHMATDGGINEGTQAITAEVRIGDFIDATDIAIYRQLAGGVTTANVLHGSANPIGGQNQVIKLRWGQLPEELKFSEAPAGIKFALGENVKQSNWGEEFRSRYPQSRLGVEQIMRDAFHAAKVYEQQWAAWRTLGKGMPPRRDLELDAILQIVNGERWIHCHSYRQDEILALMRTLESFDIQIGTFQHILEGYKVAKEMAEHGAMGSSFSDWWGYKLEVYDAIPFNGALMHNAGVVVSFNSDDRELARHLNHEAAKAVKYGGVSKEEALKFVTLNPAKQLRVDQWVGSLEPGKHADLVVWSGDPLQITSRCEQTWVDGRRLFDIETDKANRESDAALHRQLVRKVLNSGASTRKPGEDSGLFRELFPRHDEYCGHAHGHGH